MEVIQTFDPLPLYEVMEDLGYEHHTETIHAAAKPISRLGQWPCQIKLVPTQAPFFDGAKLLIAADCSVRRRMRSEPAANSSHGRWLRFQGTEGYLIDIFCNESAGQYSWPVLCYT